MLQKFCNTKAANNSYWLGLSGNNRPAGALKTFQTAQVQIYPETTSKPQNKCSSSLGQTKHLSVLSVCCWCSLYKQNFPSLSAGPCSWVMLSWFRPQRHISIDPSFRWWVAGTFYHGFMSTVDQLKWEWSGTIMFAKWWHIQSKFFVRPAPQQAPQSQIVLLPPCLSSGWPPEWSN